MSDAAEARARVIAGTDVFFDASPYATQIGWADHDELVIIELRDGKLVRTIASPFAGAKYDPFGILVDSWPDKLCAPASVPDGLFARACAARAKAFGLVAGLRAGAGWLAIGSTFILFDAALGFVQVFDGKEPFARVRILRQFEDELYQRSWAEGPEHVELVTTPPSALAEVARTFVTTLHTQLAQIDAGTHAFAHGRPIVAEGGRYLEIDLEPDGLANLLFNPYARLFSRTELVDVLSDNAEHAYVVPLTPEMTAPLPAIREALKQTRAEVVDHYVAEIRAGKRTISGGTSDGPWTARSNDGATFVISGYDENGPKEDPMTEEALREMLTSYRAYGLAEP